MKAPYKTLCCAETIVSTCLHAGSASAERVDSGRWVGSLTGCCAHGSCYIVLTVKGPWLGLGVPNLALAA